MVDPSVVPALVTVGGTFLGALTAFAGVALTNRANRYREERQAERQSAERREQERYKGAAELLSSVSRLCTLLDITAQRPWGDMNVHLAEIKAQAPAVVAQASQVALLWPGPVAHAARELGREMQDLVKEVLLSVQLRYGVDGDLLSGEFVTRADFRTLEAKIDHFYQIAAAAATSYDVASAAEAGVPGRVGKLKRLFAVRGRQRNGSGKSAAG
ncbi:hypothetical protein ACIBKY_12470 [Nonomuraea sp. NPDC050394]|uniref:hypothetical protein n=1 Tax=Nonomuraea sp. NPDC050394 TaxID=3364363 RepID=UPI00379B01D0